MYTKVDKVNELTYVVVGMLNNKSRVNLTIRLLCIIAGFFKDDLMYEIRELNGYIVNDIAYFLLEKEALQYSDWINSRLISKELKGE